MHAAKSSHVGSCLQRQAPCHAFARPKSRNSCCCTAPQRSKASSPALGRRRRHGRVGVASDVATHPEANGAVPEAEAPAVCEKTEVAYLTGRAKVVRSHFATAVGADDFMQRLEVALFAFGFTGDNSIAMVNLCRDEVTQTLKHRIEQIFGSSFSTNGLGGVLTCGKAGMGAGFSHSPMCSSSGKERYVFFSLPHISIISVGEVGPLARPGRTGQSCACGALIRAHSEILSQGLISNCKIPGVHEPLEPEYSILKQRIARRLRHEGHTDQSVRGLSLTQLTQVAERTITDDLEHLISQSVDPAQADYAVITGVQVHNWSKDFEDDSPNLEFVAPTAVYVVVDGQTTHLDLSAVPSFTPRQMRAIAGPADVCNQAGQTLLREEAAPYAFDSKDARRSKRERLLRYISLMREEGLEAEAELLEYTLQHKIGRAQPARQAGDSSVVIDQRAAAASVRELQQIRELLQQKHQQQQHAEKDSKQAAAAAAAAKASAASAAPAVVPQQPQAPQGPALEARTHPLPHRYPEAFRKPTSAMPSPLPPASRRSLLLSAPIIALPFGAAKARPAPVSTARPLLDQPMRRLKLPAGTIGRDYVLLEMQIGSRGPRVDFMVDTGLTAELITPHLRETLGLPLPNKRLQQSVGAGGSVSLPLVQLEDARMVGAENVRLPTLNAVVTEFVQEHLDPQHPVEGMLGMELLENFDADFDFPAKRLRFWRAGEGIVAAAAAGLVPVPAAVLNETGILGIRATSPAAARGAAAGGQPFVGIIDCGASFSALNWKAAALAGLPPKGDPSYSKSQAARGGGVAILGMDGRPQAVPVTDVQFTFVGDAKQEGGQFRFERPPRGWKPWQPVQAAVGDLPVFAQLLGDGTKPFEGPAAVLGLDVLSQRRVVVGAGVGLRGRQRQLYVSAA
ncbi:hypothetical protein D9Q98_005581 [Chlorella vulgaris]|uniref:Limiting CO2-inducible protein B/C beta carbonyic anhydrase domain-containing protein n=1 Tax=Chlorella vulgaris TaxID=3077 RepID=A0A9D4TMA4_CHLVU|nr:hypothetical protein D9Q98_005581 [Chlorella vulgaris]